LKKIIFFLCCVTGIVLIFVIIPSNTLHPITISVDSIDVVKVFRIAKPQKQERIEIIIGTYLGTPERNFYGTNPPQNLDINWTLNIGSGYTRVGRDNLAWSGAGWTGQPLLVLEDKIPYLIHGAFDYNLRKINAITGEEVWRYAFDDIIKGTGSLWYNPDGDSIDKYVIMQGSRQGNNVSFVVPMVPSFRAVSFLSGKELWRMNSKLTSSYSRDVDASSIVVNDTAYIGLENGIFKVFSPDPKLAKDTNNFKYPKTYNEISLYSKADQILHGGNLVTEASPAKLGNRIYIASGSGHVFGYNIKTGKIDWDFFTGSDLDGTPVVTDDSCIIVTVEKQYIKGKGGVFKLNPVKPAEESVVWYFPTENCSFFSWQGGVVGSAAINDKSRRNENEPYLSAFIGIDGFLYVVNHNKIDSTTKVKGPDNKTEYYSPELVFKYKTGPSIATPLIIEDKLIVPAYSGIYLFSQDETDSYKLLEYRNIGCVESTPIVYNGNVFISSRNGLLYCLGSKEITAHDKLYKVISLNVKVNANKAYDLLSKHKLVADVVTKQKEIKKSIKTIPVKVEIKKEVIKENIIKVVEERGNYYVIRGSFKSKENAERFAINLKQKGYFSEIADIRNGLYLVSCGSYKIEEQAKSAVSSVKASGGDAWIYIKQE
jgi:outer membrane protein assembly factor BamB